MLDHMRSMQESTLLHHPGVKIFRTLTNTGI